MVNDYNTLIREHFDISDTATRKTIIALEDAEQNQVLTALSSALYDKIVEKVDKIDFGTIPNSRGDITKVEGFENTIECLNIMRNLVLEYRQDPAVVDTVFTAIENIKKRKIIFTKAYNMNIEFPMVLYNLIVMAIEQSVSFLIAVCIQFVKDPNSKDLNAALDKVAYNNTKDNLLYEQLNSFNESCASGELDKVLDNIIKNGGKIAEAIEADDSKVNTIVINIGNDGNSVKAKCPSPFDIKEDDEVEPKDCPNPEEVEPINGDVEPAYDEPISNEQPVNEVNPLLVTGIVASIPAIAYGGLQLIRFLLKSAIPMMRSLTYFFVNSVVKFSDALSVQAQFIEANSYKLQYSTNVNMDDNKKEKVVRRQQKIAEILKNLSNKFAINNKKASKEMEVMIRDDSKKFRIEDIKNELPADIVSKSVLF